jgi:uncharacterized protein (TIGR02246 family)
MMSEDPREVAAAAVRRLQDAWNAADGEAFGAPFTDDAEFVAIRGDYHTGRETVARGHQAIFDTIYRGSTVAYEVTSARRVAEGVIVAHALSTLTSPGGPLAGTHRALATLVLVSTPEGWRVTSFHNTLVQP